MTPATIIKQATADGVSLILSPAGTLKAVGDGTADKATDAGLIQKGSVHAYS